MVTIALRERFSPYLLARMVLESEYAERGLEVNKKVLSALVRDPGPARSSAEEITVFKSAGTAVEDLAAAGLLFNS